MPGRCQEFASLPCCRIALSTFRISLNYGRPTVITTSKTCLIPCLIFSSWGPLSTNHVKVTPNKSRRCRQLMRNRAIDSESVQFCNSNLEREKITGLSSLSKDFPAKSRRARPKFRNWFTSTQVLVVTASLLLLVASKRLSFPFISFDFPFFNNYVDFC